MIGCFQGKLGLMYLHKNINHKTAIVSFDGINVKEVPIEYYPASKNVYVCLDGFSVLLEVFYEYGLCEKCELKCRLD